MQSIKRLLERNPNLLRVDPIAPEKKEKRYRYEKALRYDKVEELARESVAWLSQIPPWRTDSFTIERIFNFGKDIAKEFKVNLLEIERLFNEILPRYMRGGLSGFLVSGLYSDIIGDEDVIKLVVGRYSASISGLGYRHRAGRLEIIGSRAYYVGMEMERGEILVRGNVGNHLGKSMKGGSIIIEGNARNWVGEKMQGGNILIKGNAGHVIGKKMKGGDIVIEGNAGEWIGDDAEGGTISVRSFS